MSEAVGARRVERREREHAAARASILSAARNLAVREGAQGLTLRGVAAEAGYAPAALYSYFRNRNELILTLAADDLAQLTHAMREAAKSEAPGRSLVRVASAALARLRDSETIAAAISTLDSSTETSGAERVFNGRLIAWLKVLSEIAGRPSESREGQRDVLLIAAALAGLVLLDRSGRLSALGFHPDELVERLEGRFAAPWPPGHLP
jgi:AcrR family transcriptional regulator